MFVEACVVGDWLIVTVTGDLCYSYTSPTVTRHCDNIIGKQAAGKGVQHCQTTAEILHAVRSLHAVGE